MANDEKTVDESAQELIDYVRGCASDVHQWSPLERRFLAGYLRPLDDEQEQPPANDETGGIAGLTYYTPDEIEVFAKVAAQAGQIGPQAGHGFLDRQQAIAIDKQRLLKIRELQIVNARQAGVIHGHETVLNEEWNKQDATIRKQALEIERRKEVGVIVAAEATKWRGRYESIADRLPTYSAEDIDKPGQPFVPGVDRWWFVHPSQCFTGHPTFIEAHEGAVNIWWNWRASEPQTLEVYSAIRDPVDVTDFYSTEQAVLAAMQEATR